MVSTEGMKAGKRQDQPIGGAELVLPGQPAFLIRVHAVLKHCVGGREASVHLTHEGVKPAHISTQPLALH